VWFGANGCAWVSNGAITADAGDFGTAVDAVLGPWK
jgi:hypothetical protein